MEFCRARSVEEAVGQLADHGDEALILAGGTDVMVQYLHGEIAPAAFVHIESITELASVSLNGDSAIGPLVTHRTLATDNSIAGSHPALAAAASTVGGWQTQAVGTLGGNICNASPAADTAPPLLIADAEVALSSVRGSRNVPMSDFFVDRRVTALEPDEILTAIRLAPLPEHAGESYVKVGRRGAMEVALVGLGMRLSFTPEGAVTDARVAVCSLAPTPQRVAAAEAALIGSSLEPEAIESAGHALKESVGPIDDARASASYRMRILTGVLGRAADQCREMAS